MENMEDRDPFALARQGKDDAELFALLAEYERREQAIEESGLDEDEVARRCDYSHEVERQIEAFRPTTLRGVLALLDYHAEMYEDRFEPGCAVIEALRDMVDAENAEPAAEEPATAEEAAALEFEPFDIRLQRWFAIFPSLAGLSNADNTVFTARCSDAVPSQQGSVGRRRTATRNRSGQRTISGPTQQVIESLEASRDRFRELADLLK